jgi:hypothetical protein
VERKPAEMRQSVRWYGRLKEQDEADVMDMECGVLCAARRPVDDWATLLCGEYNELKGP